MKLKIGILNFAILISISLTSFGVSGCAKSSLKSMFGSMSIDEVGELDSPSLVIWHESYEFARAESEKTGKPILADFTGSDWCQYCVKLKQEVFEKPEFEAWARDNVVLLELDYPRRVVQNPEIKQQNEMLKQEYGISSYPTVLLIDASGNQIGKLGYMNNPTEWISAAEAQLYPVSSQ